MFRLTWRSFVNRSHHSSNPPLAEFKWRGTFPDSQERVCVILMFVVNVLVAGARRVQRCPCDFVAQGRARQRKTTVDQTLMRGLVTAGPVFVLGLPLSQGRGSVPPNHTEGCPDLPPRPPLCNEASILACLSRLRACPGETSLIFTVS